MWDADNNGYDPEDTSMPCPQCNPLGFLQEAKEQGESCGYYSGYGGYGGHGTGDTIWTSHVKAALRFNREAAIEALLAIHEVKTIATNPHEDTDVITVYTYNTPADIERLHP
jgi:hypothetical protein